MQLPIHVVCSRSSEKVLGMLRMLLEVMHDYKDNARLIEDKVGYYNTVHLIIICICCISERLHPAPLLCTQ